MSKYLYIYLYFNSQSVAVIVGPGFDCVRKSIETAGLKY